jgi:hypothetical protein
MNRWRDDGIRSIFQAHAASSQHRFHGRGTKRRRWRSGLITRLRALKFKHRYRPARLYSETRLGVWHGLQLDRKAALLGDRAQCLDVPQQQGATPLPNFGAGQNAQGDLGANATKIALWDGDARNHVAILFAFTGTRTQ